MTWPPGQPHRPTLHNHPQLNPDTRQRRLCHSYEFRASLAIAICLAVFLVRTLSPAIVGFFSDDGMYLSVARSIASGGGNVLAHVPGEPYQSKAPPLMSLLLAAGWWMYPKFPENVIWLKAFNLVFIAIGSVGVAALARAQNPFRPWLVVAGCQVVFATTPSLVGFADYTMTDVPFTAIVVLTLATWGASNTARSTSTDIIVVLLVAIATLLRNVGVALAVALALDCAIQRQPSRALLHAVVGTGTLVLWLWWAAAHHVDEAPLRAYYETYERSALTYLIGNPSLALNIVSGNIRLAYDSLPLTITPIWDLCWPVLLLLLVVGCRHLVVHGWRLPILFAVFYTGLILLHPFAPPRYLLPLVPIFLLTLTTGADRLALLIVPLARTRGTIMRLAVPLAVLVVLFAGNAAWLNFRTQPTDHVRGWSGVDMGYRWTGFEETFSWIRYNTPPDARLGSIFDGMYYLYTGRQGVRPWFHHPESYFYPYGVPRPDVGKPQDVAAELRTLGIDYVIFDPPTGFAEGEAVTAMLRAMITLPSVNATRVFRSSDGQHEVFRLWEGGTKH